MCKLFYCFLFIFFTSCKDQKTGKEKIEHYSNDTVKSLGYYKDTSMHGQFFWFYPDGKISQVATYVNGVVNGQLYQFYQSGALRSVFIYKDGKQVGYSEEYYDHSVGLLKAIRVFNENEKMIFIREYDSTGKIIRQEGNY
jgi:antitoxin component YwqK of YwqJK toxin-antitoxin module